MAFNTSNGRPVYQHRRSQSDGLNEEGQPTTDAIEEGEIAINLTTRKIYTKRATVTRDSDRSSDPLIGGKDSISDQGTGKGKTRNFFQPGVDWPAPAGTAISTDTHVRLPGLNVYGQQIQNGAQIKIIGRRLLDSDNAGRNIKLTIRQSFFLDSEFAIADSDYQFDSDRHTNGWKARHAVKYDANYAALTIAQKMRRHLHDSDGRTRADQTAVNAAGGGQFGGGVKEYTFSIDSDYTAGQLRDAIQSAVAANLPSFDVNIRAERDVTDSEILYIYGGDKLLEVEVDSNFVQYIDHSITPVYKFIVTDSDSAVPGEGAYNTTTLLNSDSDYDSDIVKRVEITFKYRSETQPRVAAVANTIRTVTNGIHKASESLIFGRRSIVLKNLVGSIGSIDSDVNTDRQFKLRPADFTGAEEIVNLNAVATISDTAPTFDLASGALWVDDRSNDVPRYDSVDSETHTIEVDLSFSGGYTNTDHDDGSTPVVPSTMSNSFAFAYGARRGRVGNSDSDSDSSKLLRIQAGDSEGSIAYKIYRIIRGDSEDGYSKLKQVIMSSTATLNGGTTIGTEANGAPADSGFASAGKGGINFVKATFDSEHDSDLFGFKIYIKGSTADSDGDKPDYSQSYSDSDNQIARGSDRTNRHKYVAAEGDATPSGFNGLVITISNKQNETGRTIFGRNAAELYWLDATLIDDATAQEKALAYGLGEEGDTQRTAAGIVRFVKKVGSGYPDTDARAYKYAEWRQVDAPSVLSPQSLSLTVAGQSFTGSTELRILDVNGTVLTSGFLLT